MTYTQNKNEVRRTNFVFACLFVYTQELSQVSEYFQSRPGGLSIHPLGPSECLPCSAGRGNHQTDSFLDMLGLSHIWTEKCVPDHEASRDKDVARAGLEQSDPNEIELSSDDDNIGGKCPISKNLEPPSKRRPTNIATTDSNEIDIFEDSENNL